MGDPIAVRRRDAIKVLGAAAAGLGLAGSTTGAQAVGTPARRFRVAHLTDLHVQPEWRAEEGLRACLRHLLDGPDRPDLILGGGDVIMDAFAQTRERSAAQWEIVTRVFREECDVPVEHCLGNHDIWGWNKDRSGTTGEEPGWGKPWAMELLGMPERYRSFDRGGWHFVVLDSVRERPGIGPGYAGGLDDEQFAWLERDLRATPAATPVLVLTHIPVVSAGALVIDGRVSPEGLLAPPPLMYADAHRVLNLFSQHRNVRVCVSGHIHIVEALEYGGMTHLCNGAVCGPWWLTPGSYERRREARRREGDPWRPARAAPGYSVLELLPDGAFTHRYVEYGWAGEDERAEDR